MRKYKALIAHPGRQHSYHSAIALKNSGIEFIYATTVYDKRGSLTNKIKKLLKGDNGKRAESRKCRYIEDDQVVQFCELGGLITLFLLRIDKSKKVYRAWNNLILNRFGKKVAKLAIKNSCDMVIMFDTTAKVCFEYLSYHCPQIKKILDVSIAARPFQKEIYELDIQRTGNRGLKKEWEFLWNDKYQQYYRREISLSDYYMVPSTFVQKSLLYCGANKDRTKIVPYGVELSEFKFQNRANLESLNLVVTGQLNYRKGMHHLLKVMEKFENSKVKLTIFGLCDLKDRFWGRYRDKKNIVFKGFVTRDAIIDDYKKESVYIFPSLCEGLSLSILEAMACGLPVLVSSNCGVNDLVRDYENGLIFEAGNDQALEEGIKWYLGNREKISIMGKKAHETAMHYTWDKYYDAYGKEILSILQEGSI